MLKRRAGVAHSQISDIRRRFMTLRLTNVQQRARYDLPTHALTRQTRFRWRKLKPVPKPERLPRDRTWQSEFETATTQGSVRLYLRDLVTAIGITD